MKHRAALCIGLGAILLLGACGDDSGGAASPTTAGNATTTTAGDNPVIGGGFVLGSGDCLSVATALATGAAGLFSPTGGADFEKGLEALDKLKADAPAEIKDDVDTVVDAWTTIRAAFEDAGVDFSDPSTYSDPSKLQGLSADLEKLDDPAISAAGDNIDAYLKAHCSTGG